MKIIKISYWGGPPTSGPFRDAAGHGGFLPLQSLKPPRGRPIGGGGVHHNYTKYIFKYYLNMLIFLGNSVSRDLLLLLNCLEGEAVLGERPLDLRFFITLMGAIALLGNAREMGTKSSICWRPQERLLVISGWCLMKIRLVQVILKNKHHVPLR